MAFFCANKFDVRDARAVCAMLSSIAPLSLEVQLAKIADLEQESTFKPVLTSTFKYYTVLDEVNGYEFICKKW